MAAITISLDHVPSSDARRCGVCDAAFVPAEDSGSRTLVIRTGAQEFAGLMCGGCHSKWSHGATVKLRSAEARGVV